jgi:DNA adenine methylase Dam
MEFVVKNSRSNLRLIPYVGNKSGFSHIFDKLILNKFSNLKFYDVFGGGGSFTFYICERFGSKYAIYNDNNPVVVNLIKTLKKEPKKLISEYEKHKEKSSLEYYNSIRDEDLNDGIIGAGKFFYLAKNAFSGKIRFNPKGKFNCPMRKNSKCPRIDSEQILYVSSIIKNLKICNKSFDEFQDVRNSFLYLDPPYLNNPNGHYNGLIKPEEFVSFVKTTQKTNKIMISEQNRPEELGLSKKYNVFPIFLNRSLQYFTQTNSKEIIAINYNLEKKEERIPLIQI